MCEGRVSPWRLRGQQSVVANLRNKDELHKVGFHKFSTFKKSLVLWNNLSKSQKVKRKKKTVLGTSDTVAYVWLRVTDKMLVSLSLLCHLSVWERCCNCNFKLSTCWSVCSPPITEQLPPLTVCPTYMYMWLTLQIDGLVTVNTSRKPCRIRNTA